MDGVPKKIHLNLAKDNISNGKNHAPAGYWDTDEDDYDDYDDDLTAPPQVHVEPAIKIMNPPVTLTANDITEEERRRFTRDTSMSGGNIAYLADDSMYKTPNESVLRNMNSFQSGDPVSMARQVRHLHNRVKLLEEELQTQHNRQLFLISFVSVYILSRGFKWMFR